MIAPRSRTLAAMLAQPEAAERYVIVTEAEAARLRLIDRRITAAAALRPAVDRMGIIAALLALALVARACWPVLAAWIGGAA